MRATVDNVVRGGSCWSAALMRPLFWWRRCWPAGADGDVTEVEAAIERVAAVSTDPRRVRNEIWLFAARGHDAAYREYRDRYRAMATSLSF
jgi:adenylate cyclase